MKNHLLSIKLSLIYIIAFCSSIFAQDSFLISFPSAPPPITVCNGSAPLQVKLDALSASNTGGDVTVQLATGIEYVPGSARVISTNAGLTITENGGTANAPKFRINTANISVGNSITFEIRRTATCAARTFDIGGGDFFDNVSATIPGANTNSKTSPEYNLLSPVLTLTQPAVQANAVLNTYYTRTFQVKNGGTGCNNNVYLEIDYPASGITNISLQITAHNGTALATPITLTPVISGTTYKYAVPAAGLPGGDLCNGESLTFTETYKIKTCNAITNYAVGWGCNSDKASWCQSSTGIGSVSMATGTPNFNKLFFTRGADFKDSCTPFTFNAQFSNGGTGDAKAAGMYNVTARLGGGSTPTLDGWFFNYHQFSNARINGVPIAMVLSGSGNNQIITVDLNNKLSVDPDGAGGLSDLDGDGFYDDLPGGTTLSIDFTVNENCGLYSCATTTAHQEPYGIYSDMKYNTMCSAAVQTSSKQTPATGSFNLGGVQVSSLSSKSYAPANVFNGVPFNARFSVGYFQLSYALDNPNTRYVYEITLPAGISVSGINGNAKWYAGQYPDNLSSTPQTPTVLVSGSTLTVTSPNQNMGYFTIDLVYTCGTSGAINIPFKLKRLDNISTGCTTCNPEVYCGVLTIGNAFCPGPCINGPSTTFVKAERADNSLGWTDSSLATLQSRSNISAYDLSKALYLDDIEVSANATQNNASSNLYLSFAINKTTGTDDKLTAKNIAVKIIRGGSVVYSATLPGSSATITSTTTVQTIVWNLTPILGGGALQPGDQIETKATYNVSSNNLPLNDVQTGNKIYFYNLDNSGTQLYCNFFVPELYLATAGYEDRFNSGVALAATACSLLNVGNGTNYLTYRFNASGIVYQNEVRPGFLPLKYAFTVPPSFDLVKVEMRNLVPSGSIVDITPSLISTGAKTYTYNIPAQGYNIPVTNAYNVVFYVYLKPTCATPASGEQLLTTVDYIPQYYHYKLNGPLPSTVIDASNRPLTYTETTRPGIAVSNTSGTIQAVKPVESAVVKLTSSGTSTAPYTWIAIPNVSGVNIQQVVDLTTNTALTPIPYSGGVWYQLSATGLATGLSNSYRVDFKYTTCSSTTFKVLAGWNCSTFPADPTAYPCGASSTDVTFVPQNGAVQIQKITEPSAPVNMCDTMNFEYRFISAGAGNTVNNKFIIKLPVGLSFVPNSLLVEYPLGSGNWAVVSTTTSGTTTTLDLATHPQYPVTGLPGTLTDGGDSNRRQMAVKFQLISSCSFRSGSSVRLTAKGNSVCGKPADGDNSTIVSNAIKINGTDTSYKISTEILTPNTVFNNCADLVALDIRQTIIGTPPAGNTGEIDIEIPAGYTYSSLSCISNCPNFIQVFADANGTNFVKLAVPAGLAAGGQMLYTINFIKAAGALIPCGAASIDIFGYDRISGIVCTTTNTSCPVTLSETTSYTYNYTVNKPDYSITSISGSFSGTTYSGKITVQNTSALSATNPVRVTFYCADDAGNSTGQTVGSYTLSVPIAAGASITENFSFTGTACSQSGRVVAVISNTDNCACSPASNSPTLFCYKPGQTAGTVLNTNHGITALGRAGTDNGNWPMVRKGAWTVLESKTKGFVVNRLTDGEVAALPAAQLREGMMVFNLTQNCLMINTDGTATGWKCFNNQACPN